MSDMDEDEFTSMIETSPIKTSLWSLEISLKT